MKNTTRGTGVDPAPADTPEKNFLMLPRREKIISQIAHYIVLLLSLGLIVFISYDTFAHIPFLYNRTYMTFQFWVCMIFLADFFLELSFARNKRVYMARRWFFLLISIPYLNIIEMFGIQFTDQTLYFIRFIPLVRGAYSLAMVVGYFSSNRAFTILAQYAFILLALIYFMSLIFYYEEREVNPEVLSFWDAVYWAFLNVTTVGSDIQAVTFLGKIGTVVMAMSGMMMLPLFTVYITDRVKAFNDRARVAEEFMARLHSHEAELARSLLDGKTDADAAAKENGGVDDGSGTPGSGAPGASGEGGGEKGA